MNILLNPDWSVLKAATITGRAAALTGQCIDTLLDESSAADSKRLARVLVRWLLGNRRDQELRFGPVQPVGEVSRLAEELVFEKIAVA